MENAVRDGASAKAGKKNNLQDVIEVLLKVQNQ